jgi:hypothetical protein
MNAETCEGNPSLKRKLNEDIPIQEVDNNNNKKQSTIVSFR